MVTLLTLQQMADWLGVSVQVFSRDVKDKGIPHLIVGKRARFDPLKVSAYLEATRTVSNVIELKHRRKRMVSRFSEAVK